MDEEPFQLADLLGERAQRDAPGDLAADACDEERTVWWGVGAGQVGQLVVEVLEVELERKRVCVGAEQRSHLAAFRLVHLRH